MHQRIEAETESCDALLLSLMYCESIFSGFTWLPTVKAAARNDQSASFFVDNGQCDAKAIGADWYALALEFKVPERKKEGEKGERERRKEKRRIKVFEEVDFKSD